MALANDLSALLKKVSSRLGLLPIEPHLPEYLRRDKWADVILDDTMVSFSRYYPNQLKMVINDDTVDKETINGTTYYYIKDEILQGVKLLGIRDIDWTDHTTNNASLSSGSLAGGYYYPSSSCPAATFESILALQFNADMNSLYNRGIYIDFEYPNRFALKGIGNTNYNLDKFTIILLVEHRSLSSISPTKMEIFEALAQADIARFLYMNLRYYDGFETAYINIDLKLSELQEEANKRENIIDEIKNSYVSTSNDAIPYIWST